MKLKIFITILLIQFSINAFSQSTATQNENFVPTNSPAAEAAAQSTSTTTKEVRAKNGSKKEKSKNQKIVEIKKPKLKKGEYAIFLDEKYEVFTTVEFNKLDINSKCAKKKGTYSCLAAKSDSLPANKQIRILEGQTHPAANYCLQIGGEAYVATDDQNQEINFCRFSDGSLVRSWSLHNKLFPLKAID